MVYRRKGRRLYYGQLRTRHGWKQQCLHTPSKTLAAKIAAAWEELATEHRAWDLLEPVIAEPSTIGALYDLWLDTGKNVIEMRRRLADLDITPLVEDWHAVHKSHVKRESSATQALAHVRRLLPEDGHRLASSVTSEWLTEQLAAIPGTRTNRRYFHSSWSQFFAYLTSVKKLYTRNPMEEVERPAADKHPPRFYGLGTVERIVAWQPDADRRALFALLYGSAIEISVALTLTRDDFDEPTKSVRAAGTKASTRDRVARIADWAWPHVWAVVRDKLPHARVFPPWDRSTCSDWHRQTVGAGTKDTHGRIAAKGLELPERLPMHNARHHWAVRALRAGTPVAVVQRQLGHGTPKLTVDTYGQFMPDAADRERWEKAATKHDAERRESAK